MRIAEIHLFSKELPVVGGLYSMSMEGFDSVTTTIVKIVSDTGLVGWGEFAQGGATYQPQHTLGVRAALSQMAPGLIGESALTPLSIRRRMECLLNGHNYAKATIDVAVMDMLGKHHGVRVCDLLGGAASERLPAYFATGIGSPDVMAELTAEKVAEGYRRIQLKAGGRDVAIDIEAIHKVWERIGDKAQLVVDPNRGMTTSQALQLSLACQQIPFSFEQPAIQWMKLHKFVIRLHILFCSMKILKT